MIAPLTAHRSPLTVSILMASAIIVTLTMSACETSSLDLPAVHRGSKVSSSASGTLLETSTGSGIQYTSYTPEKIKDKRSVLFFAKDSDPFSKMSEQRLKTIYGSGAATVSTYRVPFNESAELQLKYGVFVEDTFVLIGTGAQRLDLIIHPSEMELREILGGNRRIGE